MRIVANWKIPNCPSNASKILEDITKKTHREITMEKKLIIRQRWWL